MSSDESYLSFLEKANQDTNEASTSSNKKDTGFAELRTVNAEIPKEVKGIESFYQSDTDEAFEAVALKWDGKDLNTDSFAKLVNHDGAVEAVKLQDWNSRNRYGDVVEAVKKAGAADAEVKVFRVEHGGARCEYFVVTVNDQGIVVGVKARAVES